MCPMVPLRALRLPGGLEPRCQQKLVLPVCTCVLQGSAHVSQCASGCQRMTLAVIQVPPTLVFGCLFLLTWVLPDTELAKCTRLGPGLCPSLPSQLGLQMHATVGYLHRFYGFNFSVYAFEVSTLSTELHPNPSLTNFCSCLML